MSFPRKKGVFLNRRYLTFILLSVNVKIIKMENIYFLKKKGGALLNNALHDVLHIFFKVKFNAEKI